MIKPFLEVALVYRKEFGWPTIPNCPPDHHGMSEGHLQKCKSPGKMPLIKEWHRFSYKLPSIEELMEWGNRWPQANIGGVTGPLLGVALDIDEGGEETLANEGLAIPDTPTNLTGKGAHAIFEHPGFNVGDYVSLLPGLDVRGDRGQIVLPPSVHANGKVYTWEVSLHPTDTTIAPVPEWLVTLLTEKSNRVANFNGSPWLAELISKPILEHYRNDTLCRIAGYFHRMVSCDLNVAALVHLVNEACCKPPLDAVEVDTIIASVLKLPGADIDVHTFRGLPAAPLGEGVVARWS